MTSSNDLDRRLGAWLDDGPSRAPERTVETALAYARANPRRRDPLAGLRRDPMAGRGSGGALRPLALVATLGLLLVAALGVATVGSLLERRPVVVPPVETATPSPTTAAPSVSPSADPTPGTIHVDLIETVGADASIDITDASGTLVEATSGTPGDGASVADGEIDIRQDPADPDTLVLTWTGTPCDTAHTLLISADARTMTIERAACQGDAIAVDHVLRLTFDSPQDPAGISGAVVTTGG